MHDHDKDERLGELRGDLHEIEREKTELEEQLRALNAREEDARHKIEEIEQQGKAFVIFVDDAEYRTEQRTMTGAAIKALAGKDAAYQLFEEVEGGDDRPIGDQESVTIRNGLHFYTVPPATFGRT
jgi:TolA-binding protein